MSAVVTEMPKSDLENRVPTVINEARALAVTDQGSLDSAAAFITERIKPLIFEAHQVFDPICSANYDAWQVALRKRKDVIDPLEKAEIILKTAIARFAREQDEKRRAEERRLREEEERRQAEIREKEIEAAEREGAPADLVQALAEAPLTVAAPVVAPLFQKPAGISTVERWSAEVYSLDQLIIAAASNPSLRMYLSANTAALDSAARAAKGTMHVPGVRTVRQDSITARRR